MTTYPAPRLNDAVKTLSSVRMLALAAVFTALIAVLDLFFIPVGAALEIHFSFIAAAVGAWLYGPLWGILAGLASDTIAWLLGGYPYCFGYSLSAMLIGLLFGVAFWRQKPSLPRIIIAKTVYNLVINALLGSLWSVIYYGSKSYFAYLLPSLVKNLILLPFEIAALWFVFRAAGTAVSRLRNSSG